MKSAVTLDITVPQSRELRVVLPLEVPPGAARLVVLVRGHEAEPSEEHLTEEEEHALWTAWLDGSDDGPITDDEAGLS